MNQPEAAHPVPSPLRVHLVRLRLQTSLFGMLGSGADLLGLDGVAPPGGFGLRMDQEGSIWVDEADVARLREAILADLGAERLREMDRGLLWAGRAVEAATDRAATAAARFDPGGGPRSAHRPRRMHGDPAHVRGADQARPPGPGGGLRGRRRRPVLPTATASPGLRLSRDLLKLYEACRAADFDPDRLEREWPSVAGGLVREIRAFCRAHAGFGLVAWEGVGFRDAPPRVRGDAGSVRERGPGADRAATGGLPRRDRIPRAHRGRGGWRAWWRSCDRRRARAAPGVGGRPGPRGRPCHILLVHAEGLDVRTGSILVARIINPYMAPLFARIAGVVVEEGGLLQHSTRLAVEFGIPAVVGLAGATGAFAEGELLEVRGDTGEVLRAGPDRAS